MATSVTACPRCSAEVRVDWSTCPFCASPLSRNADLPTIPLSSATAPASVHPSGGLDEGRFAIGYLLAGRYRIMGLLGRGGMGEVYRANDLKLGQPVALKFLPPSIIGDPNALERFHAEVRIARQVSHPNVCRVYDIGETGYGVFLSMEYIDGEDLRSLLRRIGRIPGDKAVELARRLCAGLAAAHDKGILHRDLKPANIMIDGRGQILITDFGLAAVAGDIHGLAVRDGTPGYQAPEQRVGKEVTVRSDIYALGLILHEMFTGKRPDESAGSTPSALVKELDPVVERVILECLESDPRNRPGSALSVARALPGGDPLAAALAAGDTPSPQMVAAAGDTEAISMRTATVAFGVVAVGLIAVAILGNQTNILQQTPFELPPSVLEQKAREMIRGFGYTEPPADHVSGFDYDMDVERYGESLKDPAEYRSLLAKGSPSVVRFWYRQSPRYLANPDNSNVITPLAPPPIESGMVNVTLNPQGQLIDLAAVPPQVGPPAQSPLPPDWHALFMAAGLDLNRFVPADPGWLPLSGFDARAAWTGVYPGSTIPLRIEAAAWRGRPDYFQMIGSWTKPSRQPASQTDLPAAFIALAVVLLLLGSFLTWRHYKLGKSDLQGAFRLAVFGLGVAMVRNQCASHLVPGMDGLRGFFNQDASSGAYAVFLWIFYVALEPYVRKSWPQSLIAWRRLLAGGIRDPLVGENFLIGIAYGVGTSAYFMLYRLILHTSSRLSQPLSLDTISGVSLAANRALVAVESPLASALLYLFFLLLLRVLLRKPWIAAAAFTIVFALALGGIPENHPVLAVAMNLIPAASIVLVTIRSGLLAMTAAFFVTQVLLYFPVTTDLSTWYAPSTVFAFAVVLALAAYSFRMAVAGRPLFRRGFLEEA